MWPLCPPFVGCSTQELHFPSQHGHQQSIHPAQLSHAASAVLMASPLMTTVIGMGFVVHGQSDAWRQGKIQGSLGNLAPEQTAEGSEGYIVILSQVMMTLQATGIGTVIPHAIASATARPHCQSPCETPLVQNMQHCCCPIPWS